MDTSKINLPEHIQHAIWKIYYIQKVLPIIHNKLESKLYLGDNVTYTYALNYNVLRIMSGVCSLTYSL